MRKLGEGSETDSIAPEGAHTLAHEMHLRALGVLNEAPKL